MSLYPPPNSILVNYVLHVIKCELRGWALFGELKLILSCSIIVLVERGLQVQLKQSFHFSISNIYNLNLLFETSKQLPNFSQKCGISIGLV